jgi:hypothetical protein
VSDEATGAQAGPAEIYRTRAAARAGEEETLQVAASRLANLRLAASLAALVFLGVTIWRRQLLFLIPCLVCLAAFIVLVALHRRARHRLLRAGLFRRVNEEAVARLGRDWKDVPLRHDFEVSAEHPYARDLDVLGTASLFHLIDTTTSPMGAGSLARWLLNAADRDSVLGRQRAVAELAGRIDPRQELQVRGLLAEGAQRDPEPLLVWAESAPRLDGQAPLLWAARISPPLLLITFATWAGHLLPYPIWPVFLLLQIGIWARVAPRIQEALTAVAVHKGALEVYGDQLHLLAEETFESPSLQDLQGRTTAEGASAASLLRRLDSIASFALSQFSLPGFVLQSLCLWNLHVLWFLERWQRQAGPHVRGWLEALGEVEALCALAGLAHANPDWAFPEFEEAEPRLVAGSLGHPLIDPSRRVDNDVSLGPPGRCLLVTGSNMSGKSTLLRAIGTNAVLALAGAPVCARRLRLPHLRIWTSMRVEDSLERGVSFFLAEVQRLKQVFDAARQATPEGPLVCYLLDEILQGTNTAERQVAARRVLLHLADCHAIGAVSTHDLTLADAPELRPLIDPVHFTEQVNEEAGRAAMSFDHVLRPGIATSTNALRLMDLMGLALPPRPTSASAGDD